MQGNWDMLYEFEIQDPAICFGPLLHVVPRVHREDRAGMLVPRPSGLCSRPVPHAYKAVLDRTRSGCHWCGVLLISLACLEKQGPSTTFPDRLLNERGSLDGRPL